MRARHVFGAAISAAVIALSGCSTPASSHVTGNAPIQQTPALSACKDVFQPGKVVNKAKASAGCMTPSGVVEAVGAFDCADGTVLWQMDAKTGAPGGYAREGKPYVAVKGDSAADPGYKKAYEACNG